MANLQYRISKYMSYGLFKKSVYIAQTKFTDNFDPVRIIILKKMFFLTVFFLTFYP